MALYYSGNCNVYYIVFDVIFYFCSGPWSAYRSWSPGKHGYGRLKVFNGTHIRWEQVIALSDTVEDEVWIVKNYHGPYEGYP